MSWFKFCVYAGRSTSRDQNLPKLSDDQKELVASTLRSIALNYTKSKGPRPPKALLTRGPDKEISVVVMDKWNTLNWQLKLPN